MRQALELVVLSVAVATAVAQGQQENGMPPEQANELIAVNFFFGLKTENPGRISISPSVGEGASAMANLGLIDQIRAIIGDGTEAGAMDKLERINSVRQTLDYAPLGFKAAMETEASNVLNLIRWEIANFTRATNQIDRLEQVNQQRQEKGEPPLDFAIEIPRSVVACIRGIVVDFSETEPAERLRKLMTSPYRSSSSEIVADAKIRQDGIRVNRDTTKAKVGQILNYAKENNIPLETVLEEAKTIARLSRNATETGTSLNPHMGQRICESMLHLLAEVGDLSSLPFIEEMSESDDESIRFYAVMMHIRLAGIDSLDLIRRTNADRLSKMNWHTVYSSFFRTIRQQKPDEPKSDKWDDLCVFLLERIQDEKNEYLVESLDRFLLTGHPDYSNSVQRLAVAMRFIENGTQSKEYFSKAKEAIEKTPVNERKDFRAKGELLDPEQKEE